jgi:sugar phosphate permease
LYAVKTEIAPSRARQRYYPWVVIGIAFLTVAVAFGTRNAFAVFLVAVIEEFRWSRGLASGALMLGSVMWTLSAPVIGILLDRLGPRIVLPAR